MEKGQAAIEFMLTYGWIILVFVVAILALLYFGFLSPDTFNKEHCEVIPGLDCVEFRAGPEELVMVLENNLGQDVFIKNIHDSKGKCNLKEGKSIKNTEKETFVLSGCKYGTKGEQLKTELDVAYQSSTGLEHVEKALLLTFIK